jgi:hypothetical protein
MTSAKYRIYVRLKNGDQAGDRELYKGPPPASGTELEVPLLRGWYGQSADWLVPYRFRQERRHRGHGRHRGLRGRNLRINGLAEALLAS